MAVAHWTRGVIGRTGGLTTLIALLLYSGGGHAQGSDIDMSQVDIRSKELETPDKNIPENEILVYEQQRNLEVEIGQYREWLANQPVVAFIPIRQEATKVLQSIRDGDCSKVSQVEVRQLRRNLRQMAEKIAGTYPGYSSDDPWQNLDFDFSESGSARMDCEALKQVVVSSSDQLTAFIDTLEDRQNQRNKDKSKVEALVQRLQSRKAALEERLSSPQQRLSNNLWKLIFSIGGLSLGAMFLVKFFPESLQTEWVASGQVIQFVTVMILLSVIMALGLAGVLHEETLGTLLGGVGGYVLSQGVGRAAAREVTRRLAGTRLDPGGSSGG